MENNQICHFRAFLYLVIKKHEVKSTENSLAAERSFEMMWVCAVPPREQCRVGEGLYPILIDRRRGEV
jgi:hypothetical protein